mmetsp:Transcript_70228/g.222667  ORF Transcript_70228/g.222667 Transcript_70228/m.222667 type:complete len:291 (-) Transcript_70228:302-1174(-)
MLLARPGLAARPSGPQLCTKSPQVDASVIAGTLSPSLPYGGGLRARDWSGLSRGARVGGALLVARAFEDDVTSVFPMHSISLSSPSFEQQFLDMDRAFREMDADMARNMERVQARSRELQREAQREGYETQRSAGAPQTYRRENSSEERFEGGFRKSYSYESISVYGGGPGLAPQLPVQGLPAPVLFGASVVAAAYVSVLVQFVRNISATRYRNIFAPLLGALWPLLAVINPGFRAELKKAVVPKDKARALGRAGGGAGVEGMLPGSAGPGQGADVRGVGEGPTPPPGLE